MNEEITFNVIKYKSVFFFNPYFSF